MKIAIAGTGYVGLSNGILLAQHHEVVALDVVAAKVDQINRKELPIEDAEMEDYLRNKPLNFKRIRSVNPTGMVDLITIVACGLMANTSAMTDSTVLVLK